MLGPRQVMQEALFYEFSLERHVSDGHLLRRIDVLMDFSGVRDHLAPFYSNTGRPSVDPELMIRMLVVGYCFGIRSERCLCDEVHLNLAYRWFCMLGLEGGVPDHSTFSKNRHGRFRDSGLLRHVFEMVLRRCIDAGLVGGYGFAVDASLVCADANRTEGGPGSEGLNPEKTSRAMDEYFATSTTTPMAGHPKRRRVFYCHQIRRRGGQLRTKRRQSMPIPSTMWLMSPTPSSSMSRA